MLRFADLQVGQEYWYKEEGYGYEKVVVVSGPSYTSDGLIGVTIRNLDNGEEDWIGYNPNYPGYEPMFYEKDWE